MSHLSTFARDIAAAAALLIATNIGASYADPVAQEATPPPPPAKAAAPAVSDAWYAGLSAGVALPSGLPNSNILANTPPALFNISQGYKLGSGLSLGVQGGYEFASGFRAEAEFLYQNMSRNATVVSVTPVLGATSTRSYGGSQLDTYSGFINGYYDFNKGVHKLSPFVGAGLGFTHLNASAAVRNETVTVQTPGVDTTVFAYQAKAGVSYSLNAKTALFLQYRYMGTAGFPYGSARITAGTTVVNIPTISNSLSNSSVELGARFKF